MTPGRVSKRTNEVTGKGHMTTEQMQAVTKPPTPMDRAGQWCCCMFACLRPRRHQQSLQTHLSTTVRVKTKMKFYSLDCHLPTAISDI